jgi:hypothetical protein
VSPERLRRVLRQGVDRLPGAQGRCATCVVFAPQNVVSDPPSLAHEPDQLPQPPDLHGLPSCSAACCIRSALRARARRLPGARQVRDGRRRCSRCSSRCRPGPGVFRRIGRARPASLGSPRVAELARPSPRAPSPASTSDRHRTSATSCRAALARTPRHRGRADQSATARRCLLQGRYRPTCNSPTGCRRTTCWRC